MSNESVKPVSIVTEFDIDGLEFTAKERSRSGLINEYALEDMLRIIASHRSLLSANAELSFKNNLLDGAHCELLAENTRLTDAKKLYEKALGLIADAHYEGPVGALKWRDIANDALEAFDHE